MSILRLKNALCLTALMLMGTPASAVTLSGNVSFANGLYTYSYQFSEPETPVQQVLILVNSAGYSDDLLPVSTTSPAGWAFHLYSGYYQGEQPNPASIGAAFWGWDVTVAPVTAATSGFSFTTTQAPATNPKDVIYGIYSPAYHGGPGVFESFYQGSVVAPDFLLATAVPEPQIAALWLAGLALLGISSARRRSAKSSP